MNTAFWHGRRVFLTGHTGFKGSWLSLWLQQMGAELTGYALDAPTQPSLFALANVAQGMRSVIGDVRDAATLEAAMRDAKPEIVIHMAAQPLVRYSYANPVETYATNVMGVVNLFEAVRKIDSVRAVLNVTTDKCYENREWLWGYRENEALGGHDPYSSSKACAELVTAAYRSSFFGPSGQAVAVATARAGNVIGGGDWAVDRLIPDMMRAVAAARPVRIRSPHAIRPWQHVLEPLSGYLSLCEKLVLQDTAFSSSWNFGPADEDARSVEWIVERLIQSWGQDASWELEGSPQPHEANVLKLDCAKAHSLLGWKPKWGLGTAIDRIVQWHKAEQAGEDMRHLTVEQINDYQQCSLKEHS
ncbi:MAG: CDP-glucose 4,6-dehydratase [Rhodocyclales bacterium]|nr:CDP-glucose 4,6-dehydratase [Rhodocyclales bacterium]